MDSNQTTTADVATNAAGGGKQPDTQATFTQADVDRIIAERLSRQKAQFGDYDTLKAQASKWAEYETAQKSQAEKTAEQVAKLTRERDEALAQAKDRLIRAAFVAEAAKVGAAHPADVYALADLSGITVADSGDVNGVTEAVKAIVEAGRIPLSGKVQAPRLDGGAGSSARQSEKEQPLTDEELRTAKRLGISPEAYATRKKAAAAANR